MVMVDRYVNIYRYISIIGVFKPTYKWRRAPTCFLGMNHVVTPKSWKEELDSVGRTAIVTLEMLPDDPTPWII
jgi:hypothetical protein